MVKSRWTGEVVGTMHMYGITVVELADKLGWRREYLSQVLNCRRAPKDGEFKVWQALMSLVKERVDGQERR